MNEIFSINPGRFGRLSAYNPRTTEVQTVAVATLEVQAAIQEQLEKVQANTEHALAGIATGRGFFTTELVIG